jgi:hypothetical protein
VAALLLGGACASTQTYWTPAHVVAAESAVERARAAGAEQDPQAARQLNLAEGELQAARERMATGEDRDAGWLLARAQADGELSQALQLAAKATREALDAERELAAARGTMTPTRAPAPAPAPRTP